MERSRAAPRDMVVAGRAAPAKPRQPQTIDDRCADERQRVVMECVFRSEG